MEVDELEPGLLEQFGSLQTVEHSDLIRQMRRLVGGEEAISESCANFYLEMSNWNVHAAVGHYFDLNGGEGISISEKLPSMTFIRDVTIGEGESVPPSTKFVKTWCVSNSGTEPWPSGCTLRFIHGKMLQTDNYTDRVEVKRCLRPGESMDISLSMVSPPTPGIYEAQWRMATRTGAFFGDIIWIILTVEPSGTLALTQQMDQFHDLGGRTAPSNRWEVGPSGSGGLGSPSNSAVINPFASPPRRQRPVSPTDRGQPVVSVRNILERGISDNNSHEASQLIRRPPDGGCEDETMD